MKNVIYLHGRERNIIFDGIAASGKPCLTCVLDYGCPFVRCPLGVYNSMSFIDIHFTIDSIEAKRELKHLKKGKI